MPITPAQLCVVITRPQAQAEVWAVSLQGLGFSCLQLPLLEIQPLRDETQQRAIINKILDFDLYQKAIFVSQNAVEQGMEWLDAYWPQLPMGVDYFAVGATTAKKLARYGLAVTDLGATESGGMTSEDLLRAPQLQQVEGEKILIFRGVGGRGHLADELRQRGAWVDYCEVYQRAIPASAEADLQQLMVQLEQQSTTGQQWVIALHSGESLQHLEQLVAGLAPPPEMIAQLHSTRILVPSERVAGSARQAGFTRIMVAENATDPAMTAALLNFCESA